MATATSNAVGKLSREEWRREKDLDAARKAGTAPAELDEEGNEINPHTPAFIAKAPWYLDTGRPSLKHQRKPETGERKAGLDEWYARGQRAGPAATKYRKGACENCGAMSHKAKDCLERPRKKGAKWTGKDIQADEVISDVKGDYDAKRDRWNGYDPADHKRVIEQHEAIEEARRKIREEEIDNQTSTDMSAVKKAAKAGKKAKAPKEDGDFSSSDSDEEDEDKYAEAANMPGQKVDTDRRVTVRNLRIREDRAKYLYNLNPDSAHYDPKTRSMREAPVGGERPEDAQFAGDNFQRAQGDTVAMQKLQLYAWQAEARGNDLHLQANPTVNEIQFRDFQQKKEKLRESTKGSILEKYGGAEHFDTVPKELLTGQTENYVEYSRSGQIIKGQEKAKMRSKYEEDVYDNNHTAVWGSWYNLQSGEWGYGCCHSTMMNSYCTGRAGIEASKASSALAAPAAKAAESETPRKSLADGHQDKGKTRKRQSRSSSVSSSSASSSSGSELDSDSGSYSSSSSSRSRSRKRSKRSRNSKSKEKNVRSFRSQKGMGEGDVEARLDKRKLAAALAEEDRRQREDPEEEGGKKPDWMREAEEVSKRVKGGKRGFGTTEDSTEVTEEQLEAYRLKGRNNYEDPMANYVDKDE